MKWHNFVVSRQNGSRRSGTNPLLQQLWPPSGMNNWGLFICTTETSLGQEYGLSKTTFFLSYFFFLRWAISVLHDSFIAVFTQNSSILHWAVHQPISFLQLSSSLMKHCKDVLNYDFDWDTILLFVHMHTKQSHATNRYMLQYMTQFHDK